MQFLAPWMMLGMSAAAVPVVLHLLRRSKPVVVRFAAMDFLRKSVQETSKRIRFRDLLLMLMRVGVLALLAFAMSRPTLSSFSGSGPVDAVLLVDVSRSMSVVEGQGTRLDLARQAAIALLDHLPKGSTGRLLAVSDRVVELGMGQSGEFDSLKETLAGLIPTDRAGDLFPGLAMASDLLRVSPLSQRKIFLFSDMQPIGWQRQAGAIRALAKNLPLATSLHFFQTGTPVPSNLQVLDLAPVGGICFSGQRQTWQVRIRNQGEQAQTDFHVILGVADDPAGGESVRLDRLEGGEERVVALELLLPASGHFAVQAKAGSDRLQSDNQLSRVIRAHDRVRVLTVSGKSTLDSSRPSSFFVNHALRAIAGEGGVQGVQRIEVKEIRPSQALPDFLDEADLLVLCDPALVGPEALRGDFAQQIIPWVKAGKPVWYFCGGNALNKVEEAESSLNGLMPGTPSAIKPQTNPVRIDLSALQTGDWLGEFRHPPLDQISQGEFRKLIEFQKGNGPSPRSLLRFTNGVPALSVNSMGNGLVISGNWLPDLDFTDLPLRPSFVPLIQNLLAKTLDQAEDPRTIPVTGSLGVHLPLPGSIKPGDFIWLSPSGKKTPASTRKENDRLFCWNELPLDMAGVWRLQSAVPSNEGNGGGLLAVQGAGEEGRDLAPMQPGEINDLLGIVVQHESVGGDSANWSSLGEISGKILPLVLLLFIVEALFAWWCGRPL